LGRLVEDLILLYRFDTGRVEPGREMIEPGRFAREMARDFEQLCKTRGLSLTVDVVDGLPPVHASLGHLKVVFRNLLDNAIKYTPDGGTVTWRLWREDGSMVSTMTDSGRGISAEDLPHIFEPFFRGDKAHSRSVHGVGLGLSLTRSVVWFYGGDIVLLSDGDGRGTTARIWWPFGISTENGKSQG
jgi:signal transduction histidine kinase